MQVPARRVFAAAGLVATAAFALTVNSITAQQPPNIQAAVDAAYAKYRTLKEGKNADYSMTPDSVRAQRAIADISNALGGNPYAVR